MYHAKPIFLIALLSTCFVSIGCRRAPEQRYDLRGRVVDVDKGRKQITLTHEKIEGYMDAMTMPFNVADDWALSVLAPGQEVEATLVVRGDRSWIEGLRITQTDSGESSAVVHSEPELGAEIPDFRLRNQNGEKIHLTQYRGRPLLLTFIYTRCPLPDYCPLMSMRFAEIHGSLQSLPESPKKPHLLSISFDTEFDTPSVLREYAKRYMNPATFENWEFATGSPDEIKEITSYFGLSYHKESDQIIHSLVTALIGSDGKLSHLYQGNQWTPDQVLSDLRQASGIE